MRSIRSADRLIQAGRRLAGEVDTLQFVPPVAYVYNPLIYARDPYERYLSKFGNGTKRVLFLGMNPGPWGMAQTGVPFGEVSTVTNWMGISGDVGRPKLEHDKRRIEGFSCKRSEVSGHRLWGLMKRRFRRAEVFFADHFVSNYCPLIFLEESGRNRTPDKLASADREALYNLCDAHLGETIEIVSPHWLVGIGQFAVRRLRQFAGKESQVVSILHPSPASPRANSGWSEIAERQLVESGVWSEADRGQP